MSPHAALALRGVPAAHDRPSPPQTIVGVGHVDHGKSPIIGRLVADTGSLPLGKIEQDHYDICGGGIVRESLPDDQAAVRERVFLRNSKWEPRFIPTERRAARFTQRATLVLITGPNDADRKGLAKLLESRLFDEGRDKGIIFRSS